MEEDEEEEEDEEDEASHPDDSPSIWEAPGLRNKNEWFGATSPVSTCLPFLFPHTPGTSIFKFQVLLPNVHAAEVRTYDYL